MVVVVLRCPFCGRVVHVWGNLVQHVMRRHFDGRCPCCGRPVRNLVRHAEAMAEHSGDECHLVLFGILVSRYVTRKSVLAAKARIRAIEVVEVRGGGGGARRQVVRDGRG